MRAAHRWPHIFGIAAVSIAIGGCDGVQSALMPASDEARRIALLFWVLFVGSALILVGVIALTVMAMLRGDARQRWLGRESTVIGGGIIFPVITLSAVLLYGLLVMRGGSSSNASEDDPFRVSVVGERWWWRVVYQNPEGLRFESANEIRIPTRRPIEITLTSTNVIHSFWVPKLAGKLDMIPGRTNTLRFAANEPGVSRGQCAEYCGGAHALMAFFVLAMPEPDFGRWLARAAGPAEAPTNALQQQGQLLFLSSGCGGCHTIRGTAATGTIGPDLTHLGSRISLAAATLPNNPGTIAAWIVENQHIKPDNRMPPFQIFSGSELVALSHYLASLK